jgi:hypothetical protein
MLRQIFVGALFVGLLRLVGRREGSCGSRGVERQVLASRDPVGVRDFVRGVKGLHILVTKKTGRSLSFPIGSWHERGVCVPLRGSQNCRMSGELVFGWRGSLFFFCVPVVLDGVPAKAKVPHTRSAWPLDRERRFFCRNRKMTRLKPIKASVASFLGALVRVLAGRLDPSPDFACVGWQDPVPQSGGWRSRLGSYRIKNSNRTAETCRAGPARVERFHDQLMCQRRNQ